MGWRPWLDSDELCGPGESLSFSFPVYRTKGLSWMVSPVFSYLNILFSILNSRLKNISGILEVYLLNNTSLSSHIQYRSLWKSCKNISFSVHGWPSTSHVFGSVSQCRATLDLSCHSLICPPSSPSKDGTQTQRYKNWNEEVKISLFAWFPKESMEKLL